MWVSDENGGPGFYPITAGYITTGNNSFFRRMTMKKKVNVNGQSWTDMISFLYRLSLGLLHIHPNP
jgi:hypothetical protein